MPGTGVYRWPDMLLDVVRTRADRGTLRRAKGAQLGVVLMVEREPMRTSAQATASRASVMCVEPKGRQRNDRSRDRIAKETAST